MLCLADRRSSRRIGGPAASGSAFGTDLGVFRASFIWTGICDGPPPTGGANGVACAASTEENKASRRKIGGPSFMQIFF